MTRVVLSLKASVDEAEILEYLAREAGLGVAAAFRNRFSRCYRLLGEFPQSGVLRSRLGQGVRIHVVAPYLLFYRHAGDTVTILRILHGRRDLRPEWLGPRRVQ